MAQAFYRHNRQKLRQTVTEASLLIVTGHSLIQASGDTTVPFTQDSSFFYLTGLETPGLALVIDGEREYLIVPDFDEVRTAFDGALNHQALREISGIDELVSYSKAWQELNKRLKKETTVATLAPLEPYIDRYEMFVNPSRQRLVDTIKSSNDSITLVDIRPELTKMRTVKSDYEVQMIEAAIAKTKELFDVIESERQTATNERELMAAITAHRIKAGLVDAYDPIIASGANAVTLHYVENNSSLKDNEILLLDIGLKYNGYCADITRSVVANPTDRQQAVYDAVLRVHAFALTQLKPGLYLEEYENAVRDYMSTELQKLGLTSDNTEESVPKYYPHRTSHFLGIDVHDAGEYLEPLKPGVVLTVEPGIYIAEEGIGIRIEDDVLITDDGYRILSNELPRQLTSLTISHNV